MLRDGADAGQQRNLFAFYAVRITAAVPVLVQAADGFCGKVAHTEFGDDAGAAVTAQADHLLVIPMLRDADMKNPGDLRCSTGVRKHISPKQFEGLKIRLV